MQVQLVACSSTCPDPRNSTSAHDDKAMRINVVCRCVIGICTVLRNYAGYL